MERVNKGEKYWSIDKYGSIQEYLECGSVMNDYHYESLIYFHTEEETRAMRDKLRAVLKGADVIKMPDEAEIVTERDFRMRDCDIRGDWEVAFQDGFYECYDYLNSKIIK